MADHATLAEYDRIFDTRRFPPGRAVQVIRHIQPLAAERGLDDLAVLCGKAAAHAMRYIELRARRQAQSLARGGGQTRAIDSKVDSNFGQMYDTAGREARDYADEPSGRLARRLLDDCFPKGLAAVTSIAYEEQLALNEYLVVRLRRDHAEAIDTLGLDRYLRRIEALLPRYRASLDTREQIDAAELGRAYEVMQIGLMRVVGWIMAMVHDDAVRAELLDAWRDQERRLAAIYAARRRGNSASADVPLDDLDLDAEAREALAEQARAEAEARAAAEQDAAAPPPGLDVPPADRIDAPPAPGIDAGEADGLPLQPLPRE